MREQDPDTGTRQAKAAQEFMRHKGYGNVRPYMAEQVDQESCWYFYYHLPEGVLELEVELGEDGDWHWLVTAFTPNVPTATACSR